MKLQQALSGNQHAIYLEGYDLKIFRMCLEYFLGNSGDTYVRFFAKRWLEYCLKDGVSLAGLTINPNHANDFWSILYCYSVSEERVSEVHDVREWMRIINSQSLRRTHPVEDIWS